jgi:uncharacterized integral membrane protein (TIGR00698 family)
VTSFVTPPVVLFVGLAYALLCGPAFPKFNKTASKKLLQYAVVGLGFGMNLQESLASGKEGMTFTIVSVAGTMILGVLIGYKLLKVDKSTAYLISSGTAICGGSAIAAVGPTIKADENQMSIALATVFVLNAVGLFLFPVLGHWLGLSQQEFGTWAAIAIHDTSSVVGAGAAYGEEALKIATTIKLTRALWIIPLTLVTALIFRSDSKKVSIPWFILFFVVAIVVNTYLLNDVPQVGKTISGVARKALTITMFFIGASLSKETLKAVGIRPMIQGVVLWAIISVGSLAFICWSGETPRNEFRSVGVEEFAAEIAKEGVQIVDVRSKNEFDTGHIKGAVNIDVLQAEFPKKLSEKLDKERTVALYCRSGRRSKRAAEIAVKQGFTVVELDGGVLSWTGELEQ